MFKKNNIYKILKIFLDSPTTEFGLREISRKVFFAPASVKKYLQKLQNEKLISSFFSKEKPVYIANRDNQKFKIYQKISMQYEIEESGLVEYLWEKFCPEAIILFGSCSKGEAIEQSDIDIFLIAKEKKIDIHKFEKVLGREIQIFMNTFNKIPKELRNNIINGTILRGYIKI